MSSAKGLEVGTSTFSAAVYDTAWRTSAGRTEIPPKGLNGEMAE
jgi:hypothetical protein